jgi:hypothetical protein
MSFIVRAALVFPLALFGVATALSAPAKLPRLDVESSCREAQSASDEIAGTTYKSCMQDETQARDELSRRWSQFKAVNRENCLASSTVPVPSYVEVLTCLEMNDEKGFSANSSGAASASPRTNRSVVSPPVEAE